MDTSEWKDKNGQRLPPANRPRAADRHGAAASLAASAGQLTDCAATSVAPKTSTIGLEPSHVPLRTARRHGASDRAAPQPLRPSRR